MNPSKTLKEIFEEANATFRVSKAEITDEITSRIYKIKEHTMRGRGLIGIRHDGCDCLYEAKIQDGIDYPKDEIEDSFNVNTQITFVPMLICENCRERRYYDESMSVGEFIEKIEKKEIEIEPSETLKRITRGSIIPTQKWYIKHETYLAIWIGFSFGLLLGVILMWIAFGLANWLF